MTADRRRALRSGVHAFGALAMLAMLGWIVWRSPDPVGIGMGLVLILTIREMFHGVENVAARLKFVLSADGLEGEVSRDNSGEGDE